MTGTINLDTWGNTAQMCRRATAYLFHRKFVIFSRNTQSIPAKNCLFPMKNLWLNPRRQFMRYCHRIIVKKFYGMTRFVLRQHRGPAPER